MLFNNLAPLTSNQSALHYARYDEIKKYVPGDFFDKSEEEAIRDYDSRITFPHLIFLGLDETRKGDGFSWKIYSGVPYFALDVTPRGSDEQQANAKEVVRYMEAKGMSFNRSRIVTELSADEGKKPLPWLLAFSDTHTWQLLYMRHRVPLSTGITATFSAAPAATRPSL